MKILFVNRNCNLGGPTTFCYRVALGLIARGHEVHLAAQGGAMAPRFRAAGVQVQRVLPTPFNRLQIARLMRRERFDLVHACGSTAGDDVAQIARIWRGAPPWVMSVHGNLPDYVTGNRCLREAREVMTFDRSAVERLHKIPWMRERTIHRVPRPIERRDLIRTRALAPRITMVSRLSKSKGAGALAAIAAIESLQSEFPTLTLKIVGDGSLRSEIVARCEQTNARAGKPIVEASGPAVDPFVAMAGSSVVMGASYVAFEALYHEIPVVAAGFEGYGLVDSTNLEDAIEVNFGDGFPGIHKKVTPELLEDGFRRALHFFPTQAGQEELVKMREMIERNHSLDQVAQRLEMIYRLALAPGRST